MSKKRLSYSVIFAAFFAFLLAWGCASTSDTGSDNGEDGDVPEYNYNPGDVDDASDGDIVSDGDENIIPDGDKGQTDGDETQPDGDEAQPDGDEVQPDGDEVQPDGDEAQTDGDETQVDGDETQVDGDAGDLPLFSFFVTSLAALRDLSGSQNGFGGDLRYGETGAGAGLRGADKICAAIAERSMPGSSVKQWRAFLSATDDGSGNQVNAIDRIGEGPWYDRLGRMLAPDIRDRKSVV